MTGSLRQCLRVCCDGEKRVIWGDVNSHRGGGGGRIKDRGERGERGGAAGLHVGHRGGGGWWGERGVPAWALVGRDLMGSSLTSLAGTERYERITSLDGHECSLSDMMNVIIHIVFNLS